MTSSLARLFKNHVADLNDIAPNIGELFVCPICMEKYSFEDIKNNKLSRGDVWPKYIRNKSSNNDLKNQIVLLCRDCNSKAGQYGDAQMQVSEQMKDENETGDFQERHRVQLSKREDQNPIFFNVNVKIDKETKALQMSGKLDKAGRWIGNNPQMQQKFINLVGKNEPLSIKIEPTPIGKTKPKPELASVGWITSAYLFAFYTFGYRYILHDNLVPVREYICSSFEHSKQSELKLKKDVFGIREYKDKYFDNPELEIIIPLDNKEFVYLQINFLRYQINLPFQFVPSVLSYLIHSGMPDFSTKLSELRKSDSFLYFPINQTKVGGMESIYDYLLGKPIHQS